MCVRSCNLLCLLFALFIPLLSGQDEVIPDDPCFKYQLTFFNEGGTITQDRLSYKPSPQTHQITPGIHMNLPKAWSISTGSRDVVIAILDDGFFYQHEDIKGNLWQNPGETGLDENGYDKSCNDIDDDNNGYIDDVIGWDFIFEDPDPDAYIFDGKRTDKIALYTHSIPAIGIIGAEGNNNSGIAGINWDVSMMLLKLAAQGDTNGKRARMAAKAIRYAVDNGARAINWSGWISDDSDSEGIKALKESMEYAEAQDVLIVVAAGNYRKNIDKPENQEYPQKFKTRNIVMVAEIDFDGELYVADPDSRFIGGSNYGASTVHLATLAQHFSTANNENVSVYRETGGTSNAAPAVTGVAALIWSVNPDLTGQQVKEIIMKSSKKLPGLKETTISGGMLDAYAALKMAKEMKH